jgi:L-cystine uptake protein TcyP (sodium:dicarboxylate symporter family)
MEMLLPLLLGALVIGVVVGSSEASHGGPRSQRVAKIVRWSLTVVVVGFFALIAMFVAVLVIFRPIGV